MSAQKISDLIQKDMGDLPCWIEPYILPKRGTWLLGGLTGIGKSFITIELFRALSTGTRPFDCPYISATVPCRVLYVEQEIGEYGLQDRCKRAFERHQQRTYEDYAFYVSQDSRFQLDTAEGIKHVSEIVRDCRPNVLILDPISHFHDAAESDNTEIGKLFRTLAELKESNISCDMSVIMAHHFKKPPNGRLMSAGYDDLSEDNFRGAGKWTSAPDTVTTMAKRGGNKEWWEVQTRFEKMRHGQELHDVMLRVAPEEPFTQVEFRRTIGDPPKLKVNNGKQQI